MYKNNSRFSSKFKGCSPLQLSCNLTGMKPAIGYYSYTNYAGALNVILAIEEYITVFSPVFIGLNASAPTFRHLNTFLFDYCFCFFTEIHFL